MAKKKKDDPGDRLGKPPEKIKSGIYKQMAGAPEFTSEKKKKLSETHNRTDKILSRVRTK